MAHGKIEAITPDSAAMAAALTLLQGAEATLAIMADRLDMASTAAAMPEMAITLAAAAAAPGGRLIVAAAASLAVAVAVSAQATSAAKA